MKIKSFSRCLILGCLVVLLFSCFSFQGQASSGTAATKSAVDRINELFSPTELVGVPPKGQVSEYENVSALVGKALQGILGVIGSLALVIFVISGIMWMTGGGNEKQVNKARDSMVWAAIGLIAVFASYTIVKYVIQAFAF